MRKIIFLAAASMCLMVTAALAQNNTEVSGIKLSGDFRFRGDAQVRSGNGVAGPLQNIRSRYRLRLNADKDLDPRFKVHFQLSTGPLNNGLTNDQDMAGTIAKNTFSLAEAFIDFRPTKQILLRGGRTEEVFADNMRFLWDDDVRFNGFNQALTVPTPHAPLGVKSVELRSGEYFLTNPNITVLASNSPLVSAGYTPGSKVRDSMLVHPGVVVKGALTAKWNYQLTTDAQLYRNPNQIQLASTAAGVPILVNNAVGVTLSGPMTGASTATIGNGAMYTAGNFTIARAAYRVDSAFGKNKVPVWIDVQASRNVGTSSLRDAVMASANVGAVRKAKDVRILYQYAIKDANSLISQFTDDDLGTGSGVNIAVHAIRLDIGLTKFLQWQNLFFVQNERRPSNPREQFFVPLQRGANTTYRFLGQLAFSF